MQNFSPAEYVKNVKKANVGSAMVYACCHNGNCYYPTKVGHMHSGLNGRDVFGETVTLLKENGILPMGYYTVVFHNDGSIRLPHTIPVDVDGNPVRHGRYHYSCPNQDDIVEFYREQIREIVAYDLAGIFIDMTYWPAICYCDACRKKYGKPIPEIVDFRNPEWVEFQQFREKSMVEFAAKLADAARQTKPGISVTNQFSPLLHGWRLGQSAGLAQISDYGSGDFYGGKLQQRFATKAFSAFTRKKPFEFMTSRSVTLRDHTSTKSPDEMCASALTTLANGGAYLFIDAINPDGTLSDKFYSTLGELNKKLLPFRDAVAKEHYSLSAGVGLYFSISCCIDHNCNGRHVRDLDAKGNNMSVLKNAVLDETLGTADLLTKMHVPYKVIGSFDDIDDLKVIIINNALYLSEKDCETLRKFVADGGTLIATCETSLYDLEGKSTGNFQLADVFGVDFTGKFTDFMNYLGKDLILSEGIAPLVSSAGAEILEYINMPDFPYQHPDDYASIHSNPPSKQMSELPGLTVNQYGRGKCLYMTLPLLILRRYTQQEYCKKLFADYLPQFIVESENLPASAEVTLLDGDDPAKHIFCIVNYQDELPPIPLKEVKITLNLPFAVRSVIKASDGKPVDFAVGKDGLTLFIPQINAGEFFELSEN